MSLTLLFSLAMTNVSLAILVITSISRDSAEETVNVVIESVNHINGVSIERNGPKPSDVEHEV